MHDEMGVPTIDTPFLVLPLVTKKSPFTPAKYCAPSVECLCAMLDVVSPPATMSCPLTARIDTLGSSKSIVI